MTQPTLFGAAMRPTPCRHGGHQWTTLGVGGQTPPGERPVWLFVAAHLRDCCHLTPADGRRRMARLHRAVQQRARLKGYRCPHCGTVEPSDFLLGNNHGRRAEAPCMAQWLVGNHIRIDAREHRDMLPRTIERGRQLGLDVDRIIAEARAEAPA